MKRNGNTGLNGHFHPRKTRKIEHLEVRDRPRKHNLQHALSFYPVDLCVIMQIAFKDGTKNRPTAYPQPKSLNEHPETESA